MSHPSNRLERILIGKCHGIRRAKGMTAGWKGEVSLEKWSYRLRNTTKLCSCSMCGNPRRKEWKDKLTLQEKRFFEKIRFED